MIKKTDFISAYKISNSLTFSKRVTVTLENESLRKIGRFVIDHFENGSFRKIGRFENDHFENGSLRKIGQSKNRSLRKWVISENIYFTHFEVADFSN